jgi:rod shape-determining protein MreC
MFSFRRFDRSTALFLTLLVLSFLLATFDVRAQGTGVGGSLREGAQTLFSPVQRLATAVTRPVAGLIDGVSNIAGLRDEVDRLRNENDELRNQLLDVASLENRLAELQQINDLEPPGELATITARITSSSPTDFDQIRWLDKGSADGIAVGQAVVDEDGLVGRIDFVAAGSARVRLITDPRLGVGVRDLATNETGWVEGRGQDEDPQLKMFNAVKPVTEGDRLVTDGTRFPPGLSVGTVVESAEAEAGFALITTVELSIRTSELDFVKVIVGWSPLDALGEEDEQPVREGNRLVTEE